MNLEKMVSQDVRVCEGCLETLAHLETEDPLVPVVTMVLPGRLGPWAYLDHQV